MLHLLVLLRLLAVAHGELRELLLECCLLRLCGVAPLALPFKQLAVTLDGLSEVLARGLLELLLQGRAQGDALLLEQPILLMLLLQLKAAHAQVMHLGVLIAQLLHLRLLLDRLLLEQLDLPLHHEGLVLQPASRLLRLSSALRELSVVLLLVARLRSGSGTQGQG